MRHLAIRWLKFNAVGALGVLVQMGSLAILVRLFQLNYLAATALAVEAAVLHNFFWHERFTWKDRQGPGLRARLSRLWRFHAANGLISIAGNLALMRLFVGVWHIHYIAANAAAIAICSLANFAFSEWFVFRK